MTQSQSAACERRLPELLADRGRRWTFVALIANGVVQSLLAVGLALLTAAIFRQLIESPVRPTAIEVATLFAVAAGAAAGLAALRWRGHVDAERLGQSYIHDVRRRLFSHICAAGSENLSRISQGAVMLRFVGDLTAIRNWVSLGLARLIVSGLTIGGAILLLLFFAPVVAIALAAALTIAGASAFALGPRLVEVTREARRRRGRLAGVLTDRIGRLQVVEAFDRRETEQRRLSKLSHRLREALIERARTVGLLRGLAEAASTLAGLIALFIIGLGAEQSGGGAAAAMLLAGLLAPRVQELGRVWEYWTASRVARDQQKRLLHLPHASLPEQGVEPGYVLRMHNICVDGLLSDLELHIAERQRVAVIGPSGSGKSTLLKIAMGLRSFRDGTVRVAAGQEQCSPIALVSNDIPLLRGSLRLNLTYGRRDATDDEIMRILTRLGMDKRVEESPRGLDTRIAENGSEFSAGERMRLMFARALIARPKALLLDELYAPLDSEAAQLVSESLERFDGAVIHAAHDPGIVGAVDRVLYLQDGRLTSERRSSPYLVSHSSVYA